MNLSDAAVSSSSFLCFNVSTFSPSRPRERRGALSTEEPAGEMHPSLFVMDEGLGKWRGTNANVPPCARLLMVPSNMESCDSVLSAVGCH